MFDLSNVKEGGKGVNETYIYPGVRNNVKIVKWAKGKNEAGKAPFVSVFLVTKEGLENNIEAKEFKFYVSEKALPMSLGKIKHIVTKVTTEEKFASVSPANVDDLVEHLNDISRGEFLRIRFNGRQYPNTAGEIKEVAEIGLPEFAEAIQDSAEYPAIADEDTTLVYDPEKHLEKYVTDATPESKVMEATAAVKTDW